MATLKRATLAGAVLIMLAGCGGPEEGTIVEKVHFPDLSYWTVTTSCNGSSCTTLPYWVYIPECYRLKVRTPEDKLATTCVAFQAYDALQVGEYWRKPK